LSRSPVVFLCALLAACSSAPSIGDLADFPDGGTSDPADLSGSADNPDLSLPSPVSGTFTFTLDAGAFPPTTAHPSVLVYLPSGYRPIRPLSVIVYIHGFNNCVTNIVRDAGLPCDATGAANSAYALAAQLEASHKNAILVCPEVLFNQAAGNPGNLYKQDGLRALLDETFGLLPAGLGSPTSADIGQLVLASHSGGYQAAAGIALRGGIPVDELYLFDSLYGETPSFDAWVRQDLGTFYNPGSNQGAHSPRRFADIYTSGGGTLTNSQMMVTRARTWVPGDAGVLIDDRTTATWPDDTYHHGLLFKLSGLPHDGVPRYYFERMLSTSILPDKQ